jgi:transposase
MKIPVSVVSPLNEDKSNELRVIIKTSDKPRVRQRANAILLSSKEVSIDKIAELSGSNRDTVSSWIDNWEQFGISSLEDKPRSGNPGILTPKEKQLVFEDKVMRRKSTFYTDSNCYVV